MIGSKPRGTVAYLGGVPAVLEKFCWAWSQMVQYNHECWIGNQPEFIHYNRTTFSEHFRARNHLASTFLGDWLVMLDTDHEFEPDFVRRLVTMANECEVDVLSGLYRYKSGTQSPVAFATNPELDGAMQPIAVIHKPQPRILQVDAVGGGCLFIRRKVFDLIKQEKNEGPFTLIGETSEDHSFSSRCRDLGVGIWLAPAIEAQHLSIVPVKGDGECRHLNISEPIKHKGFI